jgi:protein SCO1/2
MNKLTEIIGKAVLIRWLIVAAFVLSGIIWAYHIMTEGVDKKLLLPVYGPQQEDGRFHTVKDFVLTNQNGESITPEVFEDKIYIADFFFVNCEGICPIMSNQMERVAGNFKDNFNVMFLSHTVKPEEDSVPVLKAYALEHHADDRQWHFVTGERTVINDLARSSYMLVGEDDDGGVDFVHTPSFALVDEQRRIRGFYNGTDSMEVNKLISDIGLLLQEE